MKKNVASQSIGCQMVSATDGSAFTGSVTVYVTGDNGTQAVGSVGAGACTHEGNGYHTYAPAQAETNGDLVAFTFIGTGAVPATVQVFTSFPQTGDSFGLIGATGSGLTSLATQASVNTIDDFLDTEIAAIKTVTDALPNAGALTTIQADLDDIQTRLPAALVSGRIDASVGDMAANVLTATAISADAITAAKLAADVTTEIQTGLATSAALATVAGYLDTEIADIKAKTDLIPAAPAAVSDIPTAVQNADALLGRNVSGGSSTGRTVKQAFHFIRNKWVVAAGTLTVYDTDDSTSSWTAAVTGTPGADPVTGNDPA